MAILYEDRVTGRSLPDVSFWAELYTWYIELIVTAR